MNDIKELLESAPIGVVVIDEDHCIMLANAWAQELLGCRTGESLADYVHPDSVERYDDLLSLAGGAIQLQLRCELGSKTVEARCATQEDTRQRAIFFSDISEKVALGRQLQSSRHPPKRLLQQLYSVTTTTMGYAELIDVMLREEPVVAGDRLVMVRRYHREIRNALETMNKWIKLEREGGRRPDAVATPMNRRHVVIIDDEAAITEYLAELMRGLQHKVSTFSDSNDALAYCRENVDSIDLVITDQRMPGMSGTDLAVALFELDETLPVVLCSEDADTLELNIPIHPCHKPIDITELTRIVTELI